jgi:hypothetical protein
MRSTCKVVLLCCTLLASYSGFAQQTAATTPQRDQTALAILQNALFVSVGQSSVPQVTSAQISGSIKPLGNSGYPAGTFTWTVALTATGFEFSNDFQPSDSSASHQLFVSGHGAPAVSVGGNVTRLLGHMSEVSSFTQMTLLALALAVQNTSLTVTQSSSQQIGNVLATHVHVSNDADQVTQAVTPQDWYFDPNTGLPLHLDYHSPDLLDALTWTPESRDFGNWQSIGGILLPSQITNSSNGVPMTVTTITSVQLNVPVTQSQFDLP